jgi:hypothetical protein
MRQVVRLARLFPRVRELHDQRNHLLERVAQLELELQREKARSSGNMQVKDLDRLGSLIDRLEHGFSQREAAIDPELLNRLQQLDRAKAEGRLVEFDYPYRPRVRRWRDLAGQNQYEALLAKGEARYRSWLQTFRHFRENFRRIARTASEDESDPFWDNGWFPPLDAICLYGLIASTNPAVYLEVGSGNSTKFVRRAIRDHELRTKILSIDPQPRTIVDELCDQVIRRPFEDVGAEGFLALSAGDVVFIDNSHRSFQNSDVTVFFTEIVPRLPAGVIWGVHDIFLPNDYPAEWTERFYNEQYLLMCYLLGGAGGDEIELPVAFVRERPALISELGRLLEDKPWGEIPVLGGAFWMRSRPTAVRKSGSICS